MSFGEKRRSEVWEFFTQDLPEVVFPEQQRTVEVGIKPFVENEFDGFFKTEEIP